jgi:ABC-type sugar transport system permease subunit
MTEGGPNGLTQVPSTLLYNEAFKYSNYGTGSAVSVLIFVISLLLAFFSMQAMKSKTQET